MTQLVILPVIVIVLVAVVSAGGVRSFVSLGFLRGYPFPLPPLAEQKRILKKVEDVMSLVNKLRPLVAVEK